MDAAARQAIDEIKARHPIQEVAVRYADLRRVGAYLTGRCPFHDDHHPSFAVHLATATWRCYSACDAGGDVIDLVGYARFRAAWNSRDPAMFREAVAILDGGLPPLRRALPKEWNDPASWRPIELEPRVQVVLDMAARLYHTTLLCLGRGPGTPFGYLQGRGLDEATIRKEGIGYADGDHLAPAMTACGLSRRAAAVNLLRRDPVGREFLAGRIVFIDRDRKGRVLHMVGRRFASWLKEAAPKYLSLKEIARPLHGYAQLDRRPSPKPVLVVESPPDRLTARQWGFDAVATLGAGLKESHAVQLARLKRPKIYLPHNDGGIGLEAARRWQDKIGEGTIVMLPETVKDLNELGMLPDGRRVFESLLKPVELNHG
jgi:DNA primase